MSWDPAQYARFEAERHRPALDLLVQLPADLRPREVWDLGCGAGEQAALLARRFPDGRVHGLDSSPEMLARARTRPERVDWIQADLAAWSPSAPADLILSNAALHLVPDHERLFPRLVEALAPDGVLAVQMPVVADEGFRRVVHQAAREGPWAERLTAVPRLLTLPLERYHALLKPLCETDLWRTTYLQQLTGPSPVLEWIKGAYLRRYLAALPDPAEQEAFLSVLRQRLDRLHPADADGVTLFPFTRLFILARRVAPPRAGELAGRRRD